MAKLNWRKTFRRLRSHRSYTMRELAVAVQTTVRTVQRWRKEGLTPVSELNWPLLFMGEVAKEFLQARIARRQVTLAPDEFYCVNCRAARLAQPGTRDYIYTGQSFGNGEESVWRIGRCSQCGRELARFGTRSSFFGNAQGVTSNPYERRLEGTSSFPSNVINRKDMNHEIEL